MKAVITGATGAIGRALIDEMIERGFEILVLCRAASPRSATLPKSPLVKIIDCPLSVMESYVPRENEKYDVFFHFAWEGTTGGSRNDMYLQNQNVKYTLDAVALAKRFGCHTFIGAGSQAEYGRVEGKLNGETPTFPENGYGMAKLCASEMSRVMCEKEGMRHIWTRILSVYGPHEGEYSMVGATIRRLMAGERPSFTPAEQIWDYMYSGDIAKAMVALAESGKHGRIYCLGSGQPRKLSEYIEMIRDAVDPKAELGIGDVPYAPKQVMYLCADISALKEDTGYVPSTPFEEGIAKTVEWFKNSK
ncbi:MAG: NAD(P)-dependent oxidoreductase [Clostridia bacterium]|nr:NAD(P)-dependent oxidoreductase [Clostridia bacterium]